jgi:glycosyltransferase involved in cell wall biosynthesis
LAECSLQKGGKHLETALAWAKKAYDLAKDNDSYRKYLLIKEVIAERDRVNQFIAEVKPYAKNITPKKRIIAERRFKKLPDDLKTNPAVLQLMNYIREPKIWPDKSIAIFCGNSVLKGWGPWSLASGIGGSEEAVIRISKHLQDLGYKVVVYAEPGSKDGVYDGIEWRNYWELNLKDKFDIFIAWRSPWFFDATFEARKKYLWLHDVMEVDEFTPERLANLDKVMVLGKYHRELFPNIPDDKILMTGNGIDPDTFEELDDTLERDPHRMIYTSSHTRGLEYMYDIWPDIKKAVPDATLDIYYGWESYTNVNRDNPERMAWKDKMIGLANTLDGVTDYGRIGQDQIVQETFKAGVWAYPCFLFEEVYCIAAVKAQAAGAFPVTTNKAALDENVAWGEKIDATDFSQQTLQTYKDKLIQILLDTKRQDKERKDMMQWARTNRSWRKTAEGWVQDFEG